VAARAAVAGEEAFALVPRRPLRGLEPGPFRSVLRGGGSDPAGSRAYEPGDDVRAIDWAASARLSAATGVDQFVVRERFAEQAPRIVVLADRRPAMALHPAPWLSKPRALESCERLIAASALRARGLLGRLEHGADGLRWQPPGGRGREPLPDPGWFGAPSGSLAEALEWLLRGRRVPAGSFLFVLSDFLDPVPEETWLTAVRRGWDVVGVVVQDPTWEASFPADVGGLVLPLADPAGRTLPVRLTRAEASARRAANEARLAALVARLAELGVDPLRVHDADPGAVLSVFLAWSADRLHPAGRVW
jgi:uncharacterized protein (DUF58 family)